MRFKTLELGNMKLKLGKQRGNEIWELIEISINNIEISKQIDWIKLILKVGEPVEFKIHGYAYTGIEKKKKRRSVKK